MKTCLNTEELAYITHRFTSKCSDHQRSLRHMPYSSEWM